MFRIWSLAALLLVAGASSAQRRAPPPLSNEERQLKEFVVAHYTKYEYRIPMRDGVKLFTAVYLPKDDSGSLKFPILLQRTPYSVAPYGVDRYPDRLGPSPQFTRAKYIFAYQDVRGCWMSEGSFENMRPILPTKGPKDADESTDAFDTIDWLVKRVPGNNGRVGQWGISYPGFYTAAALVDSHPALKVASPQAPVTDWFVGDDFHHNGALFLPHCFNFMANFGKARPEPRAKWPFMRFDHGTPDGYEFFLRLGPVANADARFFKGEIAFWKEMVQHNFYDDYWKARNLRAQLRKPTPAVLTVGGWFDAENLFGALEVFKQIEKHGPKPDNLLVMGPWVHGGWARGDGDTLGPVRFGSKTAKAFQSDMEFPFFEAHLRQPVTRKDLPKAYVFETGTNTWRRFPEWPPKGAQQTTFYFDANEMLRRQLASNEQTAFDEFVSNPAKPVPYFDRTSIGMEQEYMVGDQRFAARRPDVLTYSTAPFEQDFTVAGPIEVELHVATTGTDADWVVKVIDVYPDDFPNPEPNPLELKLGGYQQLLRGDVFRGKFRTGFDKPEPFTPGTPTMVRFTLNDVCHCFRAGHRLMVQVQSSWFPLVDRNPQQFCDIYTAKPEDFKKATHRVYRGGERRSGVTVLTLGGSP